MNYRCRWRRRRERLWRRTAGSCGADAEVPDEDRKTPEEPEEEEEEVGEEGRGLPGTFDCGT